MKNIAVMAGSFDPVTEGHLWVMDRALQVADKLVIIVGHNPAKKYMFTPEERANLVRESIDSTLNFSVAGRYEVVNIGNQLVIDYADSIGAQFLVRGIRNPDDFRVENEMNLIHTRMRPDIHTMFFIPPRELSEVSSSVVKSIVGFDKWQRAVSPYVTPCVMSALMKKAEKKV